jgi:hypothetical protein
MENNKQLYTELEELKLKLQARMESLQHEYNEAKAQYQSVVTTLGLLGFKPSGLRLDPQAGTGTFPFGFKGLTQAQALERIAKNNNGRFKIKEAKRILLEAGLIRTAKNANNIIYNVIVREEGKFRRIAPGEYELVT